jgi:sugar phosphate isomerase/epimerase
MTDSTRRHFLRTALAAGAGVTAIGRLGAIEPIKREANSSHIKLSLAAYSFNRHMALKGKTKPTMTMDDFADFAVGIGLDAIEPTAYYFPETTREYFTKFRGRCTRLGLDVSGTAIGNDFCKTDPAELRKQIDSTKQWIENASWIGAKTIRIFAGSVAKGDSEDKALPRCVEAIEEVCQYAGKFGIYLALENHGGITAAPEQMLRIVTAVKSPWFGVNLDTGNFQTLDPYADLAKIAPYAVVVQLKTEVHPKGKPKEDADLKRLLDILRAVNYRGYVALEYEAAEEPKTAVPKAIEALRKLI